MHFLKLKLLQHFSPLTRRYAPTIKINVQGSCKIMVNNILPTEKVNDFFKIYRFCLALDQV